MSQLLELLGKGLQHELGELLDQYYWAPPQQQTEELAAQCRQKPDDANAQFRLGLARLRHMEASDAVLHLRTACRLDADHLAARVALAAAQELAGDLTGALGSLKTANTLRPGEAPILFGIGFCYERLEDRPAAEEYYRDAVAARPHFRPARERLAALCVACGKTADAVAQYQALLEDHPEQSWLHTALAHLYFRNGQYDRAVAEFENAIALQPENWSLVDEEVEALIAEGQFREAIERLHQLLDEQGQFPDLLVRLGDLYSQTGDDDAATQSYNQAVDQQGDYLEAYVKLGTHHLLYGRWEQAAEAFHAASEISDGLMIAYVGIGAAHHAAGNAEKAMEQYDLAGAVEPNGTLLLSEMARLQLKAAAASEYTETFAVDGDASGLSEPQPDTGDLLEVQLDRHAAEVQKHGDHADVRYRYGVLLRAQGRGAEAMEQFAKAVELNPCYAQALVRLGIQQQELGCPEEAMETFSRVLDIRPHFVDVHYRLGLLYTSRGEMEKAVKHMESAVAGSPENRQIRASLALSLQNMGLHDRTVATWRSLWRIHREATHQGGN